MSDEPLRILGIAGSLRRASYNRGLLREAVAVAPADVRVDVFDLTPIPLYNADVEAQGDPEPVAALKSAIGAADALLIATPEYNYSIPGVLKNAIDWASRPPATSVLLGKPIALMGASPGRFGSVRAQLALRQVSVFTDSLVMIHPELMVSGARELFDADGNVRDEATRERVRRQVNGLVDWTRRLRAGNVR